MKTTQLKSHSILILILVTPLFVFIANYIGVYAHDFAHSITAWLLGDKQHPFDINFGGTNWANLLFLVNVNENVNYSLIYNQGHKLDIALIGFAGPGIANGALYLLSLFLLSQKAVIQKMYFFYFIFWFNLLNLGHFYDYSFVRAFDPGADVGHIVAGLNISPWWTFICFSYISAFVVWHFFTSTVIRVFDNLNISGKPLRAYILIFSILVLFGYFGAAGFMSSDILTQFLARASMLVIPGAIIICWPTRAWVSRKG